MKDMKEQFFTVSQAARYKNVSRTAIYNAITGKRLKSVEMLGKPAISQKQLDAWEVQPGPRKGRPRSAAVKARISASQKQRWAKRKAEGTS